jgi:hypothetical protein
MTWILANVWPVIVAAIGWALAWVVLHFVAKPFRDFFDLRREVSRLIALHSHDVGGLFSEIVRNDYKQIGSKLAAFDSEPVASLLIRLFGYDPKLAGDALLTISSNWGSVIKGQAVVRAIEGIKLALKLP